MSQQMPKLSSVLQNLRMPEKQLEQMIEGAGVTLPPGPAKMLVQQAESFEETGGPGGSPEFPFPTGEEFSLPTGEEGIPQPPEFPMLELPTIEGLPEPLKQAGEPLKQAGEPLKQAGEQLKNITDTLQGKQKSSKGSPSPSEVKEGLLRGEGRVEEGILRQR